MLTRVEFQFPQAPKLEKLTENEKKLLQYVEDIKKAVAEIFRTLNRPDVLVIDQATINDSVIGGTTAAAGTFTQVISKGASLTDTAGGNSKAEVRVVNQDSAAVYSWRVNSSSNSVWDYFNGASWAEAMELTGAGNLAPAGDVTINGFDGGKELRLRAGFANSASGGVGASAIDVSGDGNKDGLGLYGHDGIRLYTAAGTLRQTIGTNITQAGGQYLQADGDSATPAYSFANSTGTGMYLVSAGVTGFAAGGTAVYSYTNTGLTMASGVPIFCAATATGNASIRLPHGTAPSIPVDGDMWTTTAGLYVRINGSTVGPLS